MHLPILSTAGPISMRVQAVEYVRLSFLLLAVMINCPEKAHTFWSNILRRILEDNTIFENKTLMQNLQQTMDNWFEVQFGIEYQLIIEWNK